MTCGGNIGCSCKPLGCGPSVACAPPNRACDSRGCCPPQGESCRNNCTGAQFLPYPANACAAANIGAPAGQFYYSDPRAQLLKDNFGVAKGGCGGLRVRDPCEQPTLPCQLKRCCRPKCPLVCYQPGCIRDDCHPEKPKEYGDLLLYDNLEKFRVGNCFEDDWNFMTDGEDFISNDGRIFNQGGGLCLNSKEFQKTVDPCEKPGQLGSWHMVIFRNSQFELPACGELYAEVTASAKQFFGQIPSDWLGPVNGFGNVYNPARDFRISHFRAPILYSKETQHMFSFSLTDNDIYAHVDRWPFGRTDFGGCQGNYCSFGAHFPVMQRRCGEDPIKDNVTLGIGVECSIDKKRLNVRYYINGECVMTIPDATRLPPPSNQHYCFDGEDSFCDSVPTCFMFGFGNMDGLDGCEVTKAFERSLQPRGLVKLDTLMTYCIPQQLNNPVITGAPGEPVEQLFFDENTPDKTLFGQGVISQICGNVKVVYRC